jgi:hypothetical protein
LYGLRQAPQAWYSHFASYLFSLRFVEAKSDTTLFILWCGDYIVYLLYVNNIMLTASSVVLQRTIVVLQREFAMKDLGPLHHFLEVIVRRCRRASSPASIHHEHSRASCHVRLKVLLHAC